jgi:hypothetical protein
MRDGFEGSAEFLGFDRKVGLLAYQLVDLSTSYYGMFKLTLKPDAWRLYRYLAPDFMRQVTTMSRTALAIKGVSATWKGQKLAIRYTSCSMTKNRSDPYRPFIIRYAFHERPRGSDTRPQ